MTLDIENVLLQKIQLQLFFLQGGFYMKKHAASILFCVRYLWRIDAWEETDISSLTYSCHVSCNWDNISLRCFALEIEFFTARKETIE